MTDDDFEKQLAEGERQRLELLNVHREFTSERVEMMRRLIKRLPTSAVLIYLAKPDTLLDGLFSDDEILEKSRVGSPDAETSAIMIALADEVDARIPIAP